MGSGSSLGATMERSKLQFVMPTPPSVAPKLDDGGSGGDIGKHNHNGGGGGGDDGDDDDYFAEGDDEGDGEGQGKKADSFFRTAIPELYDRLAIGALLQEWYRTIADLPAFIRRAVELGLFSSAQLVRFLSMDVRPGLTRSASRVLSPSWAREFVGRLMADPAFMQKMVLEQVMAAGFSMYHEYKTRGANFKKELDLALINTLGVVMAVGASVWVTAPSRSFGSTHKFPFQKMLAELPHNVFDASGPLRTYTTKLRVSGFFATMAQLSAVGCLAGGATTLASQAAVALRQRNDPEFAPSVPVPELARASGGLAAFFAVNANTRYQLLGGMDRYLFGHSNYLWTYLGFTGVARLVSNAVGELSRPVWQGLTTTPAARRPVIRRVRRKRPAGTVAPTQQQRVLGGAAAAVAGAAAAAVASPAVAEGVSSASEAGVSGQEQQQRVQPPEALGDYAPVAPAAAGVAAEVGPSSSAAAAALQDYAPIGSSSGTGVEERLMEAPAVMGSVAQLQELGSQQQVLQRQGSLSDSSMGQALRDAVAEPVNA
jgi:hypothetical protein